VSVPGPNAFKSVCLAFGCYARMHCPCLLSCLASGLPLCAAVGCCVSPPASLPSSLFLPPGAGTFWQACLQIPSGHLRSPFLSFFLLPFLSPFFALLLDVLIASRLVPESCRKGPFPRNCCQIQLFTSSTCHRLPASPTSFTSRTPSTLHQHRIHHLHH
jgi:hypothetical protein